ncbi:MAG: prolipoprotein diacylglyceryl transferase family protein, partial [Planctomycetota bacterium]
YLFTRMQGLSFWKVCDRLFPSAMLGIFIGRWGCFLIGDCYGARAPENLPWSVCYPFHEKSMIPLELLNVPLHPTPIYMSLNALILFLVSLVLLKKRRFEGQVFLIGITLYALSRAWLETFRGDDEERVIYGPLSTSQWISCGILIVTFFLYSRIRKDGRNIDKAG